MAVARPAKPGFLQGLITPNPSVNYTFLVIAYAALSVIAVALFLVDLLEVTDIVKGMWIVPAPAVLTLVYALFLKSRVAPEVTAAAVSTSTVDNKKTK